ncbi:hypothetical protein ACGFNX_31325 [Streptomyces sp. NPDC048723]|uniref:hypothetical protein n=1 Tax=Streptomyces sp. NPDC048723 TaxID=3365589 RepID=UPI0037123BC5
MTTPGTRGAPDAPDERDVRDVRDVPDERDERDERDVRDVRDALDDWRRDALLLCLLPVFCWPVVVAALLGRPPAPVAALGVVLSPVLLGARELLAVRRVRRLLRDPAVRWTPYEAVVVRAGWRPPVLALAGGRHVLTLGLLGRRVLPQRPWPRTATAPATVVVRLAGDPAAGGALWAPHSGGLGHARPARRGRALPVRAWTGRARPLR